jgi:hypothetical protein
MQLPSSHDIFISLSEMDSGHHTQVRKFRVYIYYNTGFKVSRVTLYTSELISNHWGHDLKDQNQFSVFLSVAEGRAGHISKHFIPCKRNSYMS